MTLTLDSLQTQINHLKGCNKCCYKDITYETAVTLVNEKRLKPGTLYRISTVHKNKVDVTIPVLYDDGTNPGTVIYLTALTTSEFSTEGWGEFYNPKYDQTNYGSTDLQIGQQLDITTPGSDYSSTSNVAVTGGSGIGMTVTVIDDSGGLVSVVVQSKGTGYVNGDVITIADGNDDATVTLNLLPYLYNIWDGNNPSITANYSVLGRKIIWGGYVWENQTGLIGTAISVTELNSEDWSKIPYNTTDYNFVIDYIEYDWANDWISRRRCGEKVIDITFPYQYWNLVENTYGVVLHGIAVTQWGNHYNAVTELGNGLVNVNDAYYENINFKGKVMLGIEADMYSVNRNCYFGINTEHRSIRLKGKSYQTNNKIDTGGKQVDILLESQSWQDLIVIKNNSAQYNLRLLNTSWQNGAENGFKLDNNSSQSNIVLLNGSYQNDILDNGSIENNFNYNNGAYSALVLDNSQLYHFNVDASILGQTLTNCIKYNLIFKNGLAIGAIDTGSTEKYSIYGNTSNEFNFKITFTGAAGFGAVGAINIPVMELSEVGMYIEEVSITSHNLIGGVGSYITLGILTDDVDSGLTAITGLVTTINNTTQRYTSLPFTPTAAEDRYLVMAVGANAITGGTAVLNVKTRYGNFY